jgi:predicted transposase YdaD
VKIYPILNFNFKIANLSEINYHELLDSNLPESVMLAILGDFKNENPQQVIATILNRLRTVVKDDTFLQKCFFRLEILSELRNLESETVKQIRNMPITGIDIRKTYFYQEVQRLNREEGREIGLEEGLERTAINLLKKGMTVDFICECTGLSKSKVKELQKKV